MTQLEEVQARMSALAWAFDLVRSVVEADDNLLAMLLAGAPEEELAMFALATVAAEVSRMGGEPVEALRLTRARLFAGTN